jgi:hypothetical protein
MFLIPQQLVEPALVVYFLQSHQLAAVAVHNHHQVVVVGLAVQVVLQEALVVLALPFITVANLVVQVLYHQSQVQLHTTAAEVVRLQAVLAAPEVVVQEVAAALREQQIPVAVAVEVPMVMLKMVTRLQEVVEVLVL